MSKTKYAWDSSVLLAWLCEDENYPLGGIESVIQEITPSKKADKDKPDQPKGVLLVSVMVWSEILEARHTKEQMERLKSFLSRSNVIVADNDLRIAQKAGEIRGKGRAETPPRAVKTPDATHLATAIIYRADVFHTFDEGLLALNESPTVDGLKICKPISIQGQSTMF